ncbi:MAG: NADH-quinone oxidoreductase subunit M, partial [Candidatus Thiodiazotropha weberae]|nr:NADH-quinone oxidoreductase subunit M [Candidatus Thiodiazotropha lotti]MCW4211430.1 NADH-quinone oxidoreductase subunit M [Candidatus Thiodiazotropha lotti]
MPSLIYLMLTPFAGVLAMLFLPRDGVRLIRYTALFASAATLLLAWSYLGAFDQNQAGLQFVHQTEWNTRLGTTFTLGLDGFSYPMVLLATLLSLVALLASSAIRQGVKGYYMLVLLLESAMLGVFLAQDWSLFYV